MSSHKTKDKSLYFRIKQRDKLAFIEAYDKYLDDIYRFIYYKVSSKEEAEDIASQVFLKAWNYLQENKIKSKSFKALLYRIARNLIIDYYRKKSTQTVLIEDEESTGLNIADERQDIKSELETRDLYQAVEARIFELKDEYREVIILKYINELSVSEIADTLEKSHGNVRVLLYRAMKALKEIIHEENLNDGKRDNQPIK